MVFSRFIPLFTLLLFVVSKVACGATTNTSLDAQKFVYDHDKQTVTAHHDVVLEQGKQTIRADKMVYNVKDDIATAEGHVVFTDKDNNKYYADVIELDDQMRSGFLNNLFSELDDGSRMWAKKAIRKTPNQHILKDARYTPCKACQNNPDKTPSWALRASEVRHDKKEAMISYDDVRFEAWGVPIMYAPYFSHPDGTVKQKSGFLAPQLGFGSDYGFNFMMPYYWAISQDMDVTAGLKIFSKSAPQLNLEGRKRFENGSVKLVTSTTYSDRTDSINGKDVYRDNEMRGHVEFDSLWDINEFWRAGTHFKLASDEQYLDQYDIDDDDILENKAYVEGFQGRNYASVEFLGFQDLRIDRQTDQPFALPYGMFSYIAQPNTSMGGRFQWDGSFLALQRAGNDQDTNRLSTRIGWQKRDILPLGLVSQIDLATRADAYYTTDRDIAKRDPNEKNNKFDTRAIPTANLEISYPLHKKLTTSQIRVKPRIGITARPDIDNDSDIPNEDSVDTQINYTNLFDADRFSGLDRVEDRTRVNYGIEAGYYTDKGDEITVGIGQSYRFNNKDNPFQEGSGFENQQSDIVGQIGVSLDDHNNNLNYRFQLDGQTLSSERHELYGGTTVKDLSVSAVYLYEKGSQGTEFKESREQLKLGAHYDIDDNWGVSVSGLYDLGKKDKGLRQSSMGISYDDDCFGVTANLDRELQREASGANDTTVLLRFRLKNLGEFETKAYDTTSNNDKLEK